MEKTLKFKSGILLKVKFTTNFKTQQKQTNKNIKHNKHTHTHSLSLSLSFSFSLSLHFSIGRNIVRFRYYNRNPGYRGAHGIFVCFDVTNKETFMNVRQWLGEVDRYAHENVNVVIVGLKSDLREKRVVSYADAKEFCDSFNFYYFECSSKTGANMEYPLASLLKSIKDRITEANATSSLNPKLKIGLKAKKDPKNCNVQ